MNITVARDDTRRRFTAIGQGQIDASEILAFLSSLRAGVYRSYGLLFDFTAATFDVTDDDLGMFAAHGEAVRADDGPRGRVALVGSRPETHRLARTYERLTGIPNLPQLRVFETREEADRWLATESGQP
jgi:hypothetical protein